MTIQIDTYLADMIEAYLVRMADQAERILENQHIISKRQLLKFVEVTLKNTNKSLEDIQNFKTTDKE